MSLIRSIVRFWADPWTWGVGTIAVAVCLLGFYLADTGGMVSAMIGLMAGVSVESAWGRSQ